MDEQLTVNDVRLESVEDLSSNLERRDDGGETFVQEDDVGSAPGGVARSLDGDSTVGLFEGLPR